MGGQGRHLHPDDSKLATTVQLGVWQLATSLAAASQLSRILLISLL